MKDLIERLEKATGPDRELDAAIGAACEIVDDFDPSVLLDPVFYRGDECGRIRIYSGKIDPSVKHHKYTRDARPFTASIDAALTLVPEGVDWGVGHLMGWRYRAGIKFPDLSTFEADDYATPAIALCIAALKARQP